MLQGLEMLGQTLDMTGHVLLVTLMSVMANLMSIGSVALGDPLQRFFQVCVNGLVVHNMLVAGVAG